MKITTSTNAVKKFHALLAAPPPPWSAWSQWKKNLRSTREVTWL